MTNPVDTAKSAILGVPVDPNKKPSRVGVVQAFIETNERIDALEGIAANPPEHGSFPDYDANAKIYRFRDKVLVGDGAGYSGNFTGNASDYTNFPLPMRLHSWGLRDATFLSDSQFGGLSVVGHSQRSKDISWPSYPSSHAAAIGIAGFGVSDKSGG